MPRTALGLVVGVLVVAGAPPAAPSAPTRDCPPLRSRRTRRPRTSSTPWRAASRPSTWRPTLGDPIDVSANPSAIAITPNGAAAYVTNAIGESITRIDLATSTGGTTIELDASPRSITITPGAHPPGVLVPRRRRRRGRPDSSVLLNELGAAATPVPRRVAGARRWRSPSTSSPTCPRAGPAASGACLSRCRRGRRRSGFPAVRHRRRRRPARPPPP